MSDSLPNKKVTKSDQPDIQFTTGNIGRWASRQEDPFAAQNRKRVARKQQRNAKRQKAAPIIAIVFGSILSIAAIVGLVFLVIYLIGSHAAADIPEIGGSTSQDITDYSSILQKFYNQNPSATESEKLQNVQNAVNGTLSTAEGRKNEIAVKLAAASFYGEYGAYDEAIKTVDGIDPESIEDLENLIIYYNILYISYTAIGNTEKGNEYSRKLSEAIGQQLGWED